MCMCLARGGVGGEGGEWMRELGLGFTNPVGTGGVLDMCLVFWLRWCGWCMLLLFAFQSMFISIWVSRLEIVEFPDSVYRSAP